MPAQARGAACDSSVVSRGQYVAVTQVTVQVDLDHLERQIKSPLSGLAELIWNAVDADATDVAVTVETSDLGAIESVTVTDNGLGMTPQEAAKGFGALGGSWKAIDKISRRDRRVLHGSEGKGRFGAFALGDRVRWTTVAEVDGDGGGNAGPERLETLVIGTRAALSTFDISDPIATSDPTGTVVRVNQVVEKAAKAFDKDAVVDALAVAFALYLESYPVNISWRSHAVDPTDLQVQRNTYPLTIEGLDDEVTLTVIEWERTVPRALYLCDADGMALHEIKPGVQAPGFEFTAYVRWDGFADLGHDIVLAEIGHEQITPVVEAAQNALRSHFKERSSSRQRELIEQWKAENSYPYADEPKDTVERAERDLFEVVAVTAAKAVQSSDAPARKFSLRLLREAVESSPTALNRILSDVLELSQDRLDELHRLLNRTPLTSIISASKTIADRLDFLAGLDTLLFEEEPKKQTLERRQLHRMLAQETWLFGEEYALTGDDERLTAVLVKHLHLLGEDVELADGPPVTREDGTVAIPDLVLSRQIKHHHNQLEHLVVELKRPSVDIGPAELQQIEDYAFTVAQDERFKQPNVTWEFMIVGNDLKGTAKIRARQDGRPEGLVHDGNGVRVWARTWAEVLGDAKHRLKFVQDSLEYQSSRERGLTYLQETHARYLPPSLSPSSDVPAAAESAPAQPDS